MNPTLQLGAPIPQWLRRAGRGAWQGATEKLLDPAKQELTKAAEEAGRRETRKALTLLAAAGGVIVGTVTLTLLASRRKR